MAEEAKPVETIALVELARCETLAQRAAWAARFSARATGADAALLYLADPAQPGFVCAGAWGEETARRLRRTAGRDKGLARDLLRDRVPRLVRGGEAAADPLLEGLPPGAAAPGAPGLPWTP